jgi:hypothetical protein
MDPAVWEVVRTFEISTVANVPTQNLDCQGVHVPVVETGVITNDSGGQTSQVGEDPRPAKRVCQVQFEASDVEQDTRELRPSAPAFVLETAQDADSESSPRDFRTSDGEGSSEVLAAHSLDQSTKRKRMNGSAPHTSDETHAGSNASDSRLIHGEILAKDQFSILKKTGDQVPHAVIPRCNAAR